MAEETLRRIASIEDVFEIPVGTELLMMRNYNNGQLRYTISGVVKKNEKGVVTLANSVDVRKYLGPDSQQALDEMRKRRSDPAQVRNADWDYTLRFLIKDTPGFELYAVERV